MHAPTERWIRDAKIRIENAKYVLAIKSRLEDQDAQIAKLKDDVQYWMKRANADKLRPLDMG